MGVSMNLIKNLHEECMVSALKAFTLSVLLPS